MRAVAYYFVSIYWSEHAESMYKAYNMKIY